MKTSSAGGRKKVRVSSIRPTRLPWTDLFITKLSGDTELALHGFLKTLKMTHFFGQYWMILGWIMAWKGQKWFDFLVAASSYSQPKD